MNRTLGAALGLLLALLTFIAALILEGILLSMLLSMLMPSTNVGWDPVSFWRQSFHGKVTVILIVVTPFIIPLVLAVAVFKLVFRRF